DRKNQYLEDEKKWKQATEAGRLLAEKYGAPPEAGLKAADWFMAGYDSNYVDELFQTHNFTSTPTPDNEDQAPSIDTQMQESGLAEPPSTPDPTAMPDQEEGLLGNKLFGERGLFPHAGESDTEQAQRRVQETAGITPE